MKESSDFMQELSLRFENFHFKSTHSFTPQTWSGNCSVIPHICDVSKRRKSKRKMSKQNEIVHRLELWVNVCTHEKTSQQNEPVESVTKVKHDETILNEGCGRAPTSSIPSGDKPKSKQQLKKPEQQNPIDVSKEGWQQQPKMTILQKVLSDTLRSITPKPPESPRLPRYKQIKRRIFREKGHQIPVIRGTTRSSIHNKGYQTFGKKKSLTHRASFFRRPSVALPSRFDISAMLPSCKVSSFFCRSSYLT